MSFDERNSQTRIKHLILQEYAGAWSSIIGFGLRGLAMKARAAGKPFPLRMAYLDGFSWKGRYAKDSDQPIGTEPIWGSPILAMLALERSLTGLAANNPFATQLTGICVEQDRATYQALVTNICSAGLQTPINEASAFTSEAHGTVSLINGDFREHTQSIVDALDERVWLLAFIDPYGDSMRLAALRPILTRTGTDCIILFPFNEIDKHVGSARKPEEQRTRTDRDNVNRADAVFGSSAWQEIALNFDSAADREPRFVGLYQQTLQAVDPALVVKKIGLRFSKVDRTGYYLFLTTRDADGALRMNELLRKAELAEPWMLYQDREARIDQKKKATGQAELFSMEEVPHSPPPEVQPFEPDLAELDALLRNVLQPGETYTKKEVYGLVADSVFVAKEVNKVLRNLKKEGVVDFDDLDKGSSTLRVRATGA